MLLNLIGVLAAFIFIIYFIRKKFNFGFYKIIDVSIYSIDSNEFYTETLELAILMTLIFVLAKTMQETKAINKLIYSLRTIFEKGGILGILPAIYGLMPVPGGALFSAPMIDEEGETYKLNNIQKNFLNVYMVFNISNFISNDSNLQHRVFKY